MSALQESKYEVERNCFMSAQLHYGYKPIVSCYNFFLYYMERDSTGKTETDARV